MFKKVNYIFNRKQKMQLIILFLLVLIGSFCELLGVTMILPFIDAVLQQEKVLEKWYMRWVYDALHLSSVSSFLIILALLFIVIYVVKNAYMVWMHRMQYRFITNNQQRLSRRILECYLQQSYLFHLSYNSSDLIRNISSDTNMFFLSVQSILTLATDITVCLMVFSVLMLQDFAMTITVTMILIVYILLFFALIRKKIEKFGKETRRLTAQNNKWLRQTFGGIKESIILERREFFVRRYDQINGELMRNKRDYQTISLFPKAVLEVLCIGGIMLTVAVKLASGTDIVEFIPTLSLFAVAAFRLLPSFNKIVAELSALQYNKAGVDAIYKDLHQVERLYADNENQEHAMEKQLDFEKEIELKNISFHYPSVEKNVLENVNMTIGKNTSVAFVGPSGAGKTTLADIILGVLEPKQGTVQVDGLNINECMRSWHKRIGYIPQFIYLMDDTIRNNIAFGYRNKDISDEQIWRALGEAQLKEFVESLEEGLDTEIGERGVRLSGGQRQRIGIARALYHNPDFLVLDEATSALDSETETAVMDAINYLAGSKTLLIIAHRLTTIKNCDCIYEVKNQGVHLLSREEWKERLNQMATLDHIETTDV